MFFADVLTIGAVGLIVLGLAAPLRAPDDAYFPGLRAAVAAAFGVLLLGAAVSVAWPQSAAFIKIVLVAPLVEEACRIFFASRARDALTIPKMWLYFALGYALFETTLKLIGRGFAVAAGEDSRVLLYLLVPFLTLVALSLLACALLRMGWRPFQVFLVTFCLHALHNWSTFWGAQFAFRVLLASMIIAGILKWGERYATVTNEADRVSTRP